MEGVLKVEDLAKLGLDLTLGQGQTKHNQKDLIGKISKLKISSLNYFEKKPLDI